MLISRRVGSLNHSSLKGVGLENVANGRPDSAVIKLCELHVYKVPLELWREPFNNIPNTAVTETVSVGIIRVPAETRLADVRDEIFAQLAATAADDVLPRDYVFLRSVGRSLTTLRMKQEYQLKAKHFIPPVAYAPELYILEVSPEMREALAAVSDTSSQSPPLSRLVSPRQPYPHSSRLAPSEDPDTDRSRPARLGAKSRPLPYGDPDTYRVLNHNRSPTHPSSSPKRNGHPNNRDSTKPHGDSPSTQVTKRSNRDKTSPRGSQKFRYREPRKTNSDWDDPAESKSPGNRASPQLAGSRRPHNLMDGHNIDEDDDVDEDEDFLADGDKYDELLRRTKDLKDHLDADRVDLDDDDEEEMRRRLEELEDGQELDQERWHARQKDKKYWAERSKLREEAKRTEEDRKKRDNEMKLMQEIEEKRQRLQQEKNRKEEDERKREEEDEHRKEEERKKREEEERLRREEEERKRREEERERKELEERKRREENENENREEKEKLERKKKEEEEGQKAEEDRQKKHAEETSKQKEKQEKLKEEQLRKNKENEMELSFPHGRNGESSEPFVRETESARQRRRDEKNQLLKEIEEARQGRQDQEKIREELVRRAKQMQHRTTNRRNEARDMWKKKYFEEKKKTAPLEESSNRLKGELDNLHKRLLATLEGPKEKHLRLTEYRPSEKINHVIEVTKLQHEIQDLQRRVEEARMKLTAEMKLRNQAQGELRALRAELTQRKQDMEESRHKQLAALGQYGQVGHENSPAVKDLSSNHQTH